MLKKATRVESCGLQNSMLKVGEEQGTQETQIKMSWSNGKVETREGR